MYNSLPNEDIDYESDVTVHTDGRTYTIPAGTQVRLTPGESIHIQQRMYHDFTLEPGTGEALPFAAQVLPDYFSGKTGVAERVYLHIRNIPVDDLASEPIVLEVQW